MLLKQFSCGRKPVLVIRSRRFCHSSSVTWFSCRMICICNLGGKEMEVMEVMNWEVMNSCSNGSNEEVIGLQNDHAVMPRPRRPIWSYTGFPPPSRSRCEVWKLNATCRSVLLLMQSLPVGPYRYKILHRFANFASKYNRTPARRERVGWTLAEVIATRLQRLAGGCHMGCIRMPGLGTGGSMVITIHAGSRRLTTALFARATQSPPPHSSSHWRLVAAEYLRHEWSVCNVPATLDFWPLRFLRTGNLAARTLLRWNMAAIACAFQKRGTKCFATGHLKSDQSVSKGFLRSKLLAEMYHTITTAIVALTVRAVFAFIFAFVFISAVAFGFAARQCWCRCFYPGAARRGGRRTNSGRSRMLFLFQRCPKHATANIVQHEPHPHTGSKAPW